LNLNPSVDPSGDGHSIIEEIIEEIVIFTFHLFDNPASECSG
jgi:hypothetical protein